MGWDERHPRVYFICPVRGLLPEEKEKIDEYVAGLEHEGCEVRLPYRDTDQSMDGMEIVEEHERDMIWADKIFVWWNPTSQGSLWDFAQARMASRFSEKEFHIINRNDFKRTEEKSYQNVVIETE